MAYEQVPYTFQLDKTLEVLANGGLLLASSRPDGRSNVMTIGWATIGPVWGKQILVVMVRPSRYTYEFIEESGLLTVNVPTPEMRPFVNLCGTKSGRDVDKIAQVATSMGQTVDCVRLDSCSIVYECKVVHTNDVLSGTLDPGIMERSYPRGDLHRLYYGEILGTFAK